MKKYLGILLALSFSSSLWAGATFSRAKDWVDQEVLTAADLNAEFNNILNNLDPAGIDDYSLSLSQMQSVLCRRNDSLSKGQFRSRIDR